MKNHIKPIIFLACFVIMLSAVSALQLETIKVEELKEGDIIVDRYGNEIPVESIRNLPSDSLTISEYLQQKVGSLINTDSSDEIKLATAGGSSGPGSITGNSIVSGKTEKEKNNSGFFYNMINKIKGWFGK